ncbi:DUF5666 domain-containing protein [Sphaerotilus mobilis]|uniref:DUF5666 domain-containing protein n=1 Tax=Sphaerotilus mobilis TaxID=47994 RepID=A0A4Q7LS40_9BURK|nr:DUF5666 domain-containing protein [Sphaerotilus mobilis]RZS57057.1 hypothetical protein EV685_1620 [Sphaerotilus mobilis]
MSDRHGPESLAGVTSPSRQRSLSLQRVWQLGLAALALAVVAACGGGGDGVGSNGTGVSSGTVYGFGSVIVDGITFDDSDAKVEVVEGAEAEFRILTEVKLGHRTLVEASGTVSNDAGKAARIEVEPTLIGVVEAGGIGSDGRFKVLGQTVQIVPASTEQAATLMIDTPAEGDLVEVHATRSGTGTSLVHLATRIERRVAPARTGFLRLTGITEAATATSFRIGATTVNYTGTAVGTGQLVTVFAGTGDYSTTSATTGALTARAVRVRALASTSGREDYEGGVIGSVSGNVLVIDGVQVNIAAAAKNPSEYIPVAGDYVRVRGSFRSGVFFATELKRRRGDDVDLSEIKGSLSSLQLAGSTVTGFKVRDTAVTVPGSVTVDGICDNGTFVEVKGVITATGILATRVECKAVEVLGAVVERKGYVKNLDRTTSTFDLVQTVRGTDTIARVQYQPDTTFFRLIDRLDPTSWTNDILVEVEGPLASDPTAAVASFEKTMKIKLESGLP